MIDAKVAVIRAKEKAAELLGQQLSTLEELERGSIDGREAWVITLGLLRDPSPFPPMPEAPPSLISTLARLSAQPLQYKRFFIDAENGELLAMKLREFASQ
jgi:hypothetical protein